MVSEINLKIKKLKEDISVKNKLDNEIVVLERNLKNEEIELSNFSILKEKSACIPTVIENRLNHILFLEIY